MIKETEEKQVNSGPNDEKKEVRRHWRMGFIFEETIRDTVGESTNLDMVDYVELKPNKGLVYEK